MSLASLSALGVIVAPSLVVSVLFLVATFLATGIYLVVEGSPFVGLSYLLVYIGAIAILFLFVVMLMDLRDVKSATSKSSDNNTLPLAFLSGVLLLGLAQVDVSALGWTPLSSSLYVTGAFAGTDATSQLTAIGGTLFQEALVPLLMSAVLLLVAMIGPLTLCLPKNTAQIVEWLLPFSCKEEPKVRFLL